MAGEVNESVAPQVLYKYFPPERIELFENMDLRFSRVSEFNDTFDADYLVPKSQRSSKVARTIFRNRLGILCFTERPDDHLMWVNYARNHTGFVLGFDAGVSFFREDGRVLGKVKYRERPRVFAEADINACFLKSKTWAHEREWRCVRSFLPSEPRVVGIEPTLITEIIFGSKMEAWHVARIMLFATAYEMNHVKFSLSTPVRTAWTFENRPKRMSLCATCSGNGYLMEDLA